MRHEFLSPELRSAAIEAFAMRAPLWLKRATSLRFGLPLRPEVIRAGIIFIHVPKNAGTTISTALYGGHIGHRSALFYQACDPEFYRTHPSFALTRDPLSRFLSAFAFARKGGGPEVRMSQRATQAVRGFETPLDYAHHLAALSHAQRAGIDPVFRSQASYLCDGHGRVMVDRVFRLEEVAGTTFEFAGRIFSLRQRINAGTSQAVSGQSDALEEAVRALYPEDYTIFGYG